MSHKQKVPPAFSRVERGDTTLFIKEGYKEIILRMVFDTEQSRRKTSLLKQNQNGEKGSADVKFGRGSYLSVPIANNSEERFIIRDYRHGGLLGKLFGGIFLNGNRPLNEIYINEIAFQKNVPTAEVIAVCKRKLWGIFYKASFISREITGATDIIQFLKESALEFVQKSKKSIIFALVKLIRNMHDAGIYHADLHLKNILLKKDSNGKFSAYIIDLDKSVFLDRLSIDQRIKNLLRLDRSVVKLRWLSGETFIGMGEQPFAFTHALKQKADLISATDRLRFFKSYMLYDNALTKDWKMYIRQRQSHYSMHKFWWFVSGLFRK